jgi:hypothetical protein
MRNSSGGVAVPRLCSGSTRWMAGFRCRMDPWEGHGITPMRRHWFGIPQTRATEFMDGSLVCCFIVHFIMLVVSKCPYCLVWKWEFLRMYALFLKVSLHMSIYFQRRTRVFLKKNIFSVCLYSYVWSQSENF